MKDNFLQVRVIPEPLRYLFGSFWTPEVVVLKAKTEICGQNHPRKEKTIFFKFGSSPNLCLNKMYRGCFEVVEKQNKDLKQIWDSQTLKEMILLTTFLQLFGFKSGTSPDF
jgi:hypothetical protein